jgi:DNA-binding NarL/FixJ family response regulator
VRVAIADDSTLFREGLAALLVTAGSRITATAGTGAEILRLVEHDPPDVVILDIRMPPTFTDEGIMTALELRARHAGVGILVLSTYAQADYAMRLLQTHTAGIGYLLKDRVDDLTALRGALERLAAGESVVDPEIVSGLLHHRLVDTQIDGLTEREREVLRLMAEGRSNSGISASLFVSPKTVETHAAAVFTKLGLYAAPADNRRVLAVLTFLRSAAAGSAA